MPSRLERFLSAPSLIEPGQFDRRTLTTGSEALENSLQQAIESYVGDRLSAIHEPLSRLQAKINEAHAMLPQTSPTERTSSRSAASLCRCRPKRFWATRRALARHGAALPDLIPKTIYCSASWAANR